MARTYCRCWTGLVLIVGFVAIVRVAAAEQPKAFVGGKAGEERVEALTPAISQGKRGQRWVDAFSGRPFWRTSS